MLGFPSSRHSFRSLCPGVCRPLDCTCVSRLYISVFRHHERVKRSLSSLAGLPFGDLYRPSSAQDRALQQQIVGRVPYDMVDEWKERNEIDFRHRLSYMPDQFAEASQRYASEPKDHLLASLLRHCTSRRPRHGANSVERNRFMASVADSTFELLDRLEACECGILLKCLHKLGCRDHALQRALIERVLQRGQVFSPYATISALNTLVDGHAMSRASPYHTGSDDTDRLFRRLVSQAHTHLDKFNLSTLSKLTNAVSRTALDVRGLLESTQSAVFDRYVRSHESDPLWTEEVVHLLANGFSRKGYLDKALFDHLRDRILVSCAGYSVDTLVSLCNAYSKFGSAESAGYIELFSRLADEIIVQRRQMTSRHVCVVANAFAMSCLCHEELLEVLDESFVLTIDTYDSRQIAMMIHAFNKLGYRSRNRRFIWQKCTEHLDSYSWQGLTMIFHAYTKGEIRDDTTTAKFCARFSRLFAEMERASATPTCGPGEAVPGPSSVDLPQPTTYVSLVYSLVKGNILEHHALLVHLAKGCLANLSIYEPDEIANLALAFAHIRNVSTPQCKNGACEVWRLSHDVLEGITRRLGSPSLKFSAFSMAKVIESMGECGFTSSAQSVLGLIKRNILILDKLSYTHITGIIRALSTLGAHDEDVLTVLTSLKHNKHAKKNPVGG